MKITSVDCHVLLVDEYDSDACSSAQDDFVIVINTDERISWNRGNRHKSLGCAGVRQ